MWKSAGIERDPAMIKCPTCHSELSEAAVRNLVQQGQESLQAGKQSGSYPDLNRALFAFEEARRLVPQLDAAIQGVQQVKLAFAELALVYEDFDLGIALAEEDNPAHQDVLAKLRKGAKDREYRAQTLRKVKRAAIVVLILWTVGLSVVGLMMKRELDRAGASEDKALAIAERAVRDAEIAKQDAADAKRALAEELAKKTTPE
jgi:hypothetical protein